MKAWHGRVRWCATTRLQQRHVLDPCRTRPPRHARSPTDPAPAALRCSCPLALDGLAAGRIAHWRADHHPGHARCRRTASSRAAGGVRAHVRPRRRRSAASARAARPGVAWTSRPVRGPPRCRPVGVSGLRRSPRTATRVPRRARVRIDRTRKARRRSDIRRAGARRGPAGLHLAGSVGQRRHVHRPHRRTDGQQCRRAGTELRRGSDGPRGDRTSRAGRRCHHVGPDPGTAGQRRTRRPVDLRADLPRRPGDGLGRPALARAAGPGLLEHRRGPGPGRRDRHRGRSARPGGLRRSCDHVGPAPVRRRRAPGRRWRRLRTELRRSAL
jgi:hypothetical protein